MTTTLQALRARALALRSTIHNEQQLSAIELTAMCAKKTNEIIDVINELCEEWEKIRNNVADLAVQYDEITESLKIG